MEIQAWQIFLMGAMATAAFSLFFFVLVPPLWDFFVNRTRVCRPPAPSPDAQSLHATLAVVDLHCDALLSSRDLVRRSSLGHVDIPRLVRGNVAVQAFAIPTRTPVREGVPWIPTDFDALLFQVLAQRWPRRTWSSPLNRALFCASRLHDAAARSDGVFRVLRSVAGLDAYLKERAANPSITAGFLAVEGLYCIEGRVDRLRVLFDAGIRMAGLVHLGGNEVGGAAHGRNHGGLTPFGAEALKEMESLGMTVDLAHASPALIDDVLDRATRPVVVSHTGFKGVCNNERNLGGAHAQRIAAAGGVLGIGFFPWAAGGRNVDSITTTIAYGVELVGAAHIALGSDFDGAVTTPFDASRMDVITDALLRKGIAEDAIAQIMGGNALRLFRETWPDTD